MEKIIEFRFENEQINILLNGIKKITIENMTVNAKQIFEMLEYTMNDTYKIEPFNSVQFGDKAVSVKPVYDMITDLVDSINQIPTQEIIKTIFEALEELDNLEEENNEETSD